MERSDDREPYMVTLRVSQISERAFNDFLVRRLDPPAIEEAQLCPQIAFAALPLRSDEVERLREDPEVLQVVPDLLLPPAGSDLEGPVDPEQVAVSTYPLNISMVKAPQAWAHTTGRGVKVAVIDSGIVCDHPQLPVTGGVSMIPGEKWWHDDYHHGTRVAGIIGARSRNGVVGVAPECDLYAVKVLDRFGRTPPSRIVRGMCWAGEHGMDVVNISISEMGSVKRICEENYARATRYLVECSQCFIAASAGNSGRSDDKHWVQEPARCGRVVATGAVTRTRVREPVSSFGPGSLSQDQGVELVAPGWNVMSTEPGGGYAGVKYTSAASPHVAGAAALLKSWDPSLSVADIRARLRRGASHPKGGYDVEMGFGLLDCVESIQPSATHRVRTRIRRWFGRSSQPPPGP